MIPQEIIDEIKERSDIVEVVGSYIELKRVGRNYQALCPFHAEKDPSFKVNPEKQIYHCFGCGRGGTVIDFIMDFENVGFVEALRKLAQRLNINIERYLGSSDRGERLDPYYRAMDFAVKFYRERLLSGEDARAAREYLKKRGIDDELAERFLIGFAPSLWDGLYRAAMDSGVSRDILIELSLVVRQRAGAGYRDYFRNRIIFPIFSVSNRPVGLAGRVLDKSEPKYLNTAESLIYHKSRILYGFGHSKDFIRKSKTVLLVEGYMDYLMLWKSGFRNVCAVCGTSFTPDQAHLVARYAKHVYIINDGDRAGIKAAVRTAEVLLAEGIDARLVILPEDEDPDSFIRKWGAEEMEKLMNSAPDYFTYLRSLANGRGGLERKEQIIKHILSALARVGDEVRKEIYIQEVSDLFNIPVESLRVELKKSKKWSEAKVEKIETEKTNPREDIQKKILRVALEGNEYARKLVLAIDETVFEGENFRGIFRELERALNSGIDVTGSEFYLSVEDPQLSKLLSEIALLDLPPGPLDSFISDAAIWLKRAALKDDLKIMRKRIEELKKEGGDEAVKERLAIAEAYRKVSRELKKLNLKEGERSDGSR